MMLNMKFIQEEKLMEMNILQVVFDNKNKGL